MCDPPRIYFSIPEYIPFSTILCARSSQNLPIPEYTPLFNKFKFVCATFPESSPHFKNITPFSTTICDTPRIYPSLTDYTSPPFSTNVYVRSSRNLPLPPRIYPPPLFNKFICATLPESIPPSQNIPPFNNYMRHSQKLPLPPRIHPFFDNYTPPPPRIYPTSPFYNYMWYSNNLPLSDWICPLF